MGICQWTNRSYQLEEQLDIRQLGINHILTKYAKRKELVDKQIRISIINMMIKLRYIL
jgi:hypothetical protein